MKYGKLVKLSIRIHEKLIPNQLISSNSHNTLLLKINVDNDLISGNFN